MLISPLENVSLSPDTRLALVVWNWQRHTIQLSLFMPCGLTSRFDLLLLPAAGAGVIPEALGALSELKRLDLSNNSITGEC